MEIGGEYMQYGVDISTYKRVNNISDKGDVRTQRTYISSGVSFIVGFLLSRVLLSLTVNLGIAPFGVAYLIGMKKQRTKDVILSLMGIILGYLTIHKSLEGAIAYCIAAVILTIYIEICNRIDLKNRDTVNFVLIFSTFFVYNLLLNNQPIGVSLTFSSLKVLSMIPVKYILDYGLKCIDDLESNYFFSTEELISIGILVCLLVAGIGDFNISGVYLRNIFALTIIAIFSYVGGSGLGSAMGVSMGFIIGITNNDIIVAVSLYSLCGLIIGVFKDTGKLFSSVAYFIVYFIMSIYSNEFSIHGTLEITAAVAILISIPKKSIEAINKEFNQEKKAEVLNDVHLNGVKNEFVSRLDSMKSILVSLSVAVLNLGENDILSLNNKGTAMVESLADRVCHNCELKQRCWDRNIHSTFEGFSELISSCESNNISFPVNLERKCVKKNSLIKNTQEIVNNYTVNEALKTRLAEGRNLIANHIKNISLTMGDMIRDFEKDISICSEIDKIIKKALNKNKIEYKDVFCYLDKKGRMKINLTLNDCEGDNYCAKSILPIINSLVRVPVSISNEGCRINPDTNECSIVIEETPKYHMASYASVKSKEGETSIGDSYSFTKNDDGTYLTIVSDGMGSGPEAGVESSLAVDLIEKFIENGFSEKTAINTVNSIMAMKFNEDEKFTTMDLNLVDLYTGEAEFIKIGGVVSFIKRGDEVKVIKSNSLPFGILDNVDISSEKTRLKHGDIIISISDGVLDIDKNNVGSYSWLEEYLQYADTNPSALSRDILEKAMVLSGGKVWDDMTVLVSKIYSVY